MSPGEVAELVENLKSCKDYLEMERLLSDSLRKDIIKLR